MSSADIFTKYAKSTIKVLISTATNDILILFFTENKAGHFMWIFCLADNLHEMISLIFPGSKKIRMLSDTILLRALMVNYAPNFKEVGGAYCFWGFHPLVTLFDA